MIRRPSRDTIEGFLAMARRAPTGADYLYGRAQALGIHPGPDFDYDALAEGVPPELLDDLIPSIEDAASAAGKRTVRSTSPLAKVLTTAVAFGDTVEFGIPRWIRGQTSLRHVVDTGSGSYTLGEILGIAVPSGTSIYRGFASIERAYVAGSTNAVAAAGSRASPALTHITSPAAGAAIAAENQLRGAAGIYAGPASNATRGPFSTMLATGLSPSRQGAAVAIPAEAASVFQSVSVMGPMTLWQRAMGTRFTTGGVLNLRLGQFSATARSSNQAVIYGLDVATMTIARVRAREEQ